MTIDEAIEILRAVVEGGKLITDKQQREATKLGLEALYRIKEARKREWTLGVVPLLGETE